MRSTIVWFSRECRQLSFYDLAQAARQPCRAATTIHYGESTRDHVQAALTQYDLRILQNGDEPRPFEYRQRTLRYPRIFQSGIGGSFGLSNGLPVNVKLEDSRAPQGPTEDCYGYRCYSRHDTIVGVEQRPSAPDRDAEQNNELTVFTFIIIVCCTSFVCFYAAIETIGERVFKKAEKSTGQEHRTRDI